MVTIDHYQKLRQRKDVKWETQQGSVVIRVHDDSKVDSTIGSSVDDSSSPSVSSSSVSLHRLLHLDSFLPLSTTDRRTASRETIDENSLVMEAATTLAVAHFNERKIPTLPHLEERLKQCNVRFTLGLLDTNTDRPSKSLYPLLFGRNSTLSTPLPAGVLGGASIANAKEIGTLAGVSGIPYLSATISSSAYFEGQHTNVPTFARTIPSSGLYANAVVKLLQHWDVTHAGVIYSTTKSLSFLEEVVDMAIKSGLSLSTSGLDPTRVHDKSYLTRTLNKVRDLRYFVVAGFDDNANMFISSVARGIGMATNDHVFIVPDSSTVRPDNFILSEANSELATSLSGVAMVDNRYTHNDAFHTGLDMLQTDGPFRQHFIDSHTNPELLGEHNFTVPLTVFKKHAYGTYDAVMALGLAACDIPNDFFTGQELYQQVLRTSFCGLSGDVNFDPQTGSRLADGIAVEVDNVIIDKDRSGDGYFQFRTVPSLLLEPESKSRCEAKPYKSTESSTTGPLKTSSGQSGSQQNEPQTNSTNTGIDRNDNDNGDHSDNNSNNNIDTKNTASGDAPGVVEEGNTEVPVYWRELEPFRFRGGSTVPPPSLPMVETNLNLIPSGVRAFAWGLASFSIMVSLVLLVWTIIYRKRRLVRAAQPVFLVMMCVGSAMMGLSALFLGWQEPWPGLDFACMATPWLLTLGFSTSFSALLTKTWRINMIFRSAVEMTRTNIHTKDVIWPIFLITFINVVLLTAWTVHSPLHWNRRESLTDIDQFGRSTSSVGTCVGNPDVTWILLILFNFGMVVFANWQTYLSRNIPHVFNESVHVSVIMASLLEIFVIGAPIHFIIKESPTASFVAETTMIAFVSMAIVVPIFISKLNATQDRAEELDDNMILVAWSSFRRQATGSGRRNSSMNLMGSSRGAERRRSSGSIGAIDDMLGPEASGAQFTVARIRARASMAAPTGIPRPLLDIAEHFSALSSDSDDDSSEKGSLGHTRNTGDTVVSTNQQPEQSRYGTESPVLPTSPESNDRHRHLLRVIRSDSTRSLGLSSASPSPGHFS